MNREIKFRGKSKETGNWVYGSLNIEFDGTTHIVYWVSKLLEPENNYHEMVHEMVEVAPETVGQYVEIKDTKNLMDIHEGDIVSCWDNAAKDPCWGLDKIHTGIITNTPPCYSLKIPGKLTYDGGSVKHWDNDVHLSEWCNAENIEVIGNIHDNPELIKTT